MNLFEAKEILKKNNYQIIKEAVGDKKFVVTFDITRTVTYNGTSTDPSERRSYHIFMSQRKKALEAGDRAAAAKLSDDTKIGGAKFDRQKVSTGYTSSSIWLDPKAIKEHFANVYNLNAKEEHTQVDVMYEDYDGNPYYEYGVAHLFHSMLVGESEPYVAMTMTRTYRITLTGDAEDIDAFANDYEDDPDGLASEIITAGKTMQFKSELVDKSATCKIAEVDANDEISEDDYTEVGNIVKDTE